MALTNVRLFLETRTPGQRGERVTQAETNPTTLAEVEAAVRALDNDQTTMLIIALGEGLERQMSLAGGRRHISVATQETVDGPYRQLARRRATAGAKEVELVCGGQLVGFDSRHVIGVGAAVRVARHWARTGGRHPDFDWVE